jgi:hypothetical protein
MEDLARRNIPLIVVLCFLFFTVQACSEKTPEPAKKSQIAKKAVQGVESSSGVETAKIKKGSLKAVLRPENPTVRDILKVEIMARRGEKAPSFTVRWYVNEDPVDGGGDNLDLSSFMRGDRVYAEVNFHTEGHEPLITDVTSITNAPPEISAVNSETAPAGGGIFFFVDAEAFDPDKDDVTLKYRFYVNDSLESESDVGKFDISKLKRGDRIHCAVAAGDSDAWGDEKATPLFKISNRPPRIVSSPPSRLMGDIFTYKIAGEDPDGDTLLYELVTGPEGMILMEDTLHWDMRPDHGPGPVKAVVKASDGHGGDATQEFSLSAASN